jgi:hypothetical protein
LEFFWNIFEQIKHQKQSFFFSNMPCFSKMFSTNGNGLSLKHKIFPLQDDGFLLQGLPQMVSWCTAFAKQGALNHSEREPL